MSLIKLNDHFAKTVRGSADIRVQHLKLKRGDKCPKYISQWFITKHSSLNAFNL